MPDLGAPEIILLLVVLILLFGAKKLPETARGLGRSLRIFKAETKGLREDDDATTRPVAPIEIPQYQQGQVPPAYQQPTAQHPQAPYGQQQYAQQPYGQNGAPQGATAAGQPYQQPVAQPVQTPYQQAPYGQASYGEGQAQQPVSEQPSERQPHSS